MTPAETAIRDYAEMKRFGAAVVARWLRCVPADQRTTYAVVEHLRLGENQVRDLLDTLEAIALRRRCTLSDILNDAAVTQVLTAGRARNETIHGLKAALRRLRYPQLTQAEARLQVLIRDLHLPAGASVTLPENLEGEEVVVSVRGASAVELRRRMASAVDALAADGIEEMFRVLEGEW